MKPYYNQFIKNFPYILIMLFPLGMVIGPLVGEILMGILIIMFLFRITRKKDFALLNIKFVKFFLIFYLLISINTIISFVEIEITYKLSFIETIFF